MPLVVWGESWDLENLAELRRVCIQRSRFEHIAIVLKAQYAYAKPRISEYYTIRDMDLYDSLDLFVLSSFYPWFFLYPRFANVRVGFRESWMSEFFTAVSCNQHDIEFKDIIMRMIVIMAQHEIENKYMNAKMEYLYGGNFATLFRLLLTLLL